MDKITSKTNSKIKDLVRLHKSKEREKMGYFLVEGFHMLEMALKANVVKEVYTLKQLDLPSDITQYLVTEEIIDKISINKSSQGVVAKCVLLKKKLNNQDKIIYLDNISDPGNLGTILRTALAFDYFDVIKSPNSVSIYNEKSLSATQGAVFELNIIDKDYEVLLDLKNRGYLIVVTSLRNAMLLSDITIPQKCVLVFGNEGQGVRKEILEIADITIKIPINNIESLNVGVAAGILMHHFR